MTFYLRFAVCLLLSTSMFISSTPSYAGAEVPPEGYINEIFFDPGGDGVDARDEYIELRGTPNALLDNHYLLIIENEMDEFGIGDAGIVENLFDLSGRSFGENGFLLLRQKFSRYTPEQINPLATDLVNDGPNLPGPSFPGYGDGEDSTIGASDLNTTLTGPGEGTLENSGFTAFLIRNDSGEAPVLGLDIDEGNDGLDMPTLQAGWTVLDGVGVFSEFDETENGRLYAQVNFGSEDPIFPLPSGFEPKIESGAEFYLANHEIEYIGRWGNSTGQTVADWHASNLTDNPRVDQPAYRFKIGDSRPTRIRRTFRTILLHRSPHSSSRALGCRTAPGSPIHSVHRTSASATMTRMGTLQQVTTRYGETPLGLPATSKRIRPLIPIMISWSTRPTIRSLSTTTKPWHRNWLGRAPAQRSRTSDHLAADPSRPRAQVSTARSPAVIAGSLR